QSTTFRITTPYSLYICPEGQNVTLTCKFSGSLANWHDVFSKAWYYSNKADQSCSQRKYVRNVTMKELHHEQRKHHGLPAGNSTAGKASQGQQENYHGVEASSDHHGTFNLTIANLTLQDIGHYCCYMVEFSKEHNKLHAQQQAYGFMELRIQKGRIQANGTFPNCILHPASSTESENITAAALATGACIVGILCLPLILLLIYKQRQAITNRHLTHSRVGKITYFKTCLISEIQIDLVKQGHKTDLLFDETAKTLEGFAALIGAHELVRMESNAHGIENPVFDDIPTVNSESKPRPQLTYMASRLPSESGRHLLSEPNTPLSPPGTGDCFFPSLEKSPIRAWNRQGYQY
ncbi:hypothetical protein JD844_006391, partial [Phrynosoma platyrhinos]